MLGIFALACWITPGFAQQDHGAAIDQLKTYHFGGNPAPLDEVDHWVDEVRADPDRRQQAARALAAVLTSDALFDAKQFICRKLALIGGEDQVPSLAALLPDDQLGSLALLAIARIPGAAVDRALLAAMIQSHDQPRLGIIATLGERHVVDAIAPLTQFLDSNDRNLNQAAAFALASIGRPGSDEALEAAFIRTKGERHAAFGHAMLICVDRAIATGDTAAAIRMCTLLDKDPTTPVLRAAALRGLALANPQKAIPLVLDALGDDGSPRQLMAARLARELPGPQITIQLCESLPKLSPSGQQLTVAALSDRADRAAAPALLALMRGADAASRVSALRALGWVGDASTVPILLRAAASGKVEEQEIAREGLARMRDPAVDESLLHALDDSDGAIHIEAIGAIGRRRVTAALPHLLRDTRSNDKNVSAAAVRVLGDMGQPDQLSSLLDVLLTSPRDERAPVTSVIVAIAQRGTDDISRTDTILKRLSDVTKPGDRADLVGILGSLAGSGALSAVRKAAADPDPDVRLTAVRQLAAWPTPDPMDDLLAAVRASQDEIVRSIALRGYLRMIGMDDSRPDDQSLALYKNAAALAGGPADRRLILAGVAKLRSLSAFDYAAGFVKDTDLRAEGEAAVVDIGRGIAGAWPEKTRAGLDPIAQASTDENLRKKAADTIDFISKFADFVTAWEVSPIYLKDGAGCQQLFDIPFAPEQAEHAKDVHWRIMPVAGGPDQPWMLDLLAVLGGEQRVAYLRTSVWSEAPRDLVLELGSDDGVKAWWNGTVVAADNTMRPVAPGQDKVKVQVKAGWNDLLLKITQNNMGWAACARFSTPDGTPVKGLKWVVPSAKPL